MVGTEPTRHGFDNLAVWRTSLPGVQHAVLPTFSDRPNPRLADTMLFVSVFSPGFVHALDAATGEICWSRGLSGLGSSSVELVGDLLLARTAQTLYAMDRASGSIRWEFCPHGRQGESIYSDPVVDRKRLFIGDRRGWLYCLDVETGETIWKRMTSDARKRAVNATGIVVDGLVITATNAGLVLAYSVEDGDLVWQYELDGPCIHHLFLVGKQIVVATESLYFLSPANGELCGRVQWPGLAVGFAAGTPTQVALFRLPSSEELKKDGGMLERNAEADTVLMFEGTRLIREIRCSGYPRAIRFSGATGLLYASGLNGIDIMDPATGEWLHTLRPVDAGDGCGLPDVANDRIYVMDGNGVVCALHHP